MFAIAKVDFDSRRVNLDGTVNYKHKFVNTRGEFTKRIEEAERFDTIVEAQQRAEERGILFPLFDEIEAPKSDADFYEEQREFIREHIHNM